MRTALGRGISRESLVELLVRGRPGAVLAQLSADAEIHDPHGGRIKGRVAIAAHLEERSAWFASREATAYPLDLTIDGPLELEEVDVSLVGPTGPATMPVAVVIERGVDDRIRELRLYYCAWFIRGEETTRSPLLPADQSLRGPGVVEAYHRLLADGDGVAMGELFAEGSYIREPLGTIADGLDSVKEWHRQFSEGSGAGMPLHWCSKIDDGRVAAFEYMAEQWGERNFAPIGGICVFDRDESDTLIAIRVYEEASPDH